MPLQAQVEQWIDFSTISIDAPVQSWVYPLLMPSFFPYDKKVRPLSTWPFDNAHLLQLGTLQSAESA